MSPKKDFLRDRRRNAQLLTTARDIFPLVLAGEVHDPLLNELEIVNITDSPDVTGLTVVLCALTTPNEHEQEQLSQKFKGNFETNFNERLKQNCPRYQRYFVQRWLNDYIENVCQ